MSSCDEDVVEETGITLEQLHEIAKQRQLERKVASNDEGECSEDERETKKMKVEDESPPHDGEDEGLTVLTQHESKGKTGPIKYQLPKWVTQYCPIKEDISEHSIALDTFNIHHKIKCNLATMGVSRLFPVQATIIPDILNSAKGPLLTQQNGLPPSDICVCAPTGCGKTLAYVIPVVHAIQSECTTCKLRVLVVVPSQDLALQVSSVFKGVCKGTKVKVGTLCGQKTLDEEIEGVVSPLGSKVDVLVCTPGRLVSHLQRSHSLTLNHLRYLIIDEADRIFEQHYHNWLNYVIEATVHRSQQPSDLTTSMLASSSVPFLFPELMHSLPKLGLYQIPQQPQSHSGSSYPSSHTNPRSSPFSLSTSMCDVFTGRQPIQKLLFSATLSLDPEKLSLLCLNRPKLFSVSPVTGENVGEGVLPLTLSEYMLVSSLEHKPLYLLYLINVIEEGNNILCFVHSKFSTRRLTLVLQQYDISVEEVSANVSQEARKAIVKRFKSGKTKVLVCSDGMSRGMDIESVNSVINYDAPSHFKSYLHRVGRTARAGAKGTAYTILTREEVAHFNKIVRSARGQKKIKKIAASEKDIQPFSTFYSQALENVAAIVGQ